VPLALADRATGVRAAIAFRAGRTALRPYGFELVIEGGWVIAPIPGQFTVQFEAQGEPCGLPARVLGPPHTVGLQASAPGPVPIPGGLHWRFQCPPGFDSRRDTPNLNVDVQATDWMLQQDSSGETPSTAPVFYPIAGGGSAFPVAVRD
jgi:hypothetical protein